MKHLTKSQIQNLHSRERANLINTISGYKSANLIATHSKSGQTNVAIFNSVIHLGSDPALLGFILRPLTVPRHTYTNIKETSTYTLNTITDKIFKDAHTTSAKYEESEFDKTNLTPIYKAGFTAPFVKESPIQIGCRYVNEYPIQENGCILMVGSVEHIHIDSGILQEDYWTKLDEAQVLSIVGLDGYAQPKLLDRLSYAKPDQTSKSLLDGTSKSKPTP